MRTVLIGTDFTYDSRGKLIPIEINTAIGWNRAKPERNEDVFDLSILKQFIIDKGFKNIIYMGALQIFDDRLKILTDELQINHEMIVVNPDSSTSPEIDDDDDTLIIRSSYDVTAIVDETYCKNKINFLNLIQNKKFGHQFAYFNRNKGLVNNIKTIPDNGNHPNFILKCVYPHYDHKVYPKLYKVTTQDELNVILKNVDENYFLMEFYMNTNKLYEGNMAVIRSLNLLFPPDLKSIPLGKYTRITERNLGNGSLFNSHTYEVDYNDRHKYLTSDSGINRPKLLDDDYVQMSDGTFKTGYDLQINDVVKTLIIPNVSPDLPTSDYMNFGITYDEFVSGTTYSTNIVMDKRRVDKLVQMSKITFTDGSTWTDTENSIYLVLKNGYVKFALLQYDPNYEPQPGSIILAKGDSVILVDYRYEPEVVSVIKEVESVEHYGSMFGGWEITVQYSHLFLTRSDDDQANYVAIEHNQSCPYMSYMCWTAAHCSKSPNYMCCGPWSTCISSCGPCPV